MVAVFDNFLIMVDGVTGKTRDSFAGLTGGRFAAETIIAATADLPGDADVDTFIETVNTSLSSALRDATGGEEVTHPPGAQVATYSVQRREVWRIGDISVRIDGAPLPVNSPPTDQIVANFRAAYLQAHLTAGATTDELLAHDPSRDAIHPLLLMQDVFANNDNHPLAYPVVNGTPIPRKFVEVFSVPPGRWVTFATDGYPQVEATLEASETCLRELLELDPLCIGSLRGTKGVSVGNRSFDDRAWLRFRT